MRGLLAYTRALYQMYLGFHWESSGCHYYSDHLLYQRLYEGVQGEIDQLAERILGTDSSNGLDPVTDVEAAAKMLGGMTSDSSGPGDFPEEAIRAEETFLELLTKTIKDGVSDGTEDLLQGIASQHEEHLYLLRQRAKTAGISVNKKTAKKEKTKRPPKKWWDKMKREIKKSNPDYSDKQIAATIGDIWFSNLSEKKRKQISKRDRKAKFLYMHLRSNPTMIIELFKLAHSLDKKAEYELSSDVDKIILELQQRAGLELKDFTAVANYLDEQGDTELADKLDALVMKAIKK